jgi:hypothetical protein
MDKKDKDAVRVIKNPRVEANHVDYVICHRVIDLPIPYVAAQIEHCSKCDERIWVAHTSPKKPPRICHTCIAPLMEKDDEVRLVITERQMAEVRNFMKDRPK